MTNTEQALEFNRIKEKLAEFAYTENAKNRLRSIQPYLSESELRSAVRDTTETRMLCEKAGNPPFSSMEGIDEYIKTAEMGACLTGEELENVEKVLTAVKRLKDYLEACKQYNCSIAYYEENLESMEEIRDEIRQTIRGGQVDDYASKLLKSLRSNISLTENKMREKADIVMRANKASLSDSFSTVRNGHICIPVKKDCKSKIRGTVMDKSATGATIFIEPEAAGKYYEELQLLKLEEENEERRILYTLTAMLADKAEVIHQNTKTIEKLDFMFAKGRLSLEMEAVEPDINTDRKIRILKGRHPLMEKSMAVPLDFEIGNEVNGIVITGPNTGGKTVAIKTVALNCMMAQCGLHVTCKYANICMNDAYLCDIGDGQNISENLSTFSAHIMNVMDILRRADRDSLVIMDELGSGTDPTEGMGIAIAILEELKKSGALYLVTTHYPEVKNYAEKEAGVVNARMTFDKESLKPLYQLVIGEAGESCAFYIAEKLGMPAGMLRRAEAAAYGTANRNTKIQDRTGNAYRNAGENTRRDCDKKVPGNHPKGKQQESESLEKMSNPRIQKRKVMSNIQREVIQYNLGDSVMVYPDKKIGIVCQTADEKGVLRIQLPNKKIYISHKRIKLHVPASQLYPPDYDFSIIFDTVENRKLRHDMERKYVEDGTIKIQE